MVLSGPVGATIGPGSRATAHGKVTPSIDGQWRGRSTNAYRVGYGGALWGAKSFTGSLSLLVWTWKCGVARGGR